MIFESDTQYIKLAVKEVKDSIKRLSHTYKAGRAIVNGKLYTLDKIDLYRAANTLDYLNTRLLKLMLYHNKLESK